MDGIINVLKPPGLSSHQVVNVIRKLVSMKRVGHTGTLDPGAAGVLPICVGKGTRIVPFLIDQDKHYIAEMTLGLSTTTQDASGETIDLDTDLQITPEQLALTLHTFLGEVEQLPPMTSAIRIKGQRLYELARQGKEIQRDTRKITIKELHINKIWNEQPDLTFGSRVLLDIMCSKGTYIRTLCHDIGIALGTVAHMSFLCRIQSGIFKIEDSYTLEEIEEKVQNRDLSFVQPIESALPQWPKVIVSPLSEHRILHGNFILPQDLLDVPRQLVLGDQVLLFNVEGTLLALAELVMKEQLICQPTRVLKEGE